MIGFLFELVLIQAGYCVTWARDGLEALEKLPPEAPPVNAVISDIQLGEGPDGWQVARWARSRHPGIPIIYMTSESGAIASERHAPWGVILRKPFHIDQMVEVLGDLLNADQSRLPINRRS